MWRLLNEDIPDHIWEHPAQAPRGRKAKGLAELCLHHTMYSHPQVPWCEQGFRLARGGCHHMSPHQPDHKIIQALFLAWGFRTAAASLTDQWGWAGGHQHYQTHTQLSHTTPAGPTATTSLLWDLRCLSWCTNLGATLVCKYQSWGSSLDLTFHILSHISAYMQVFLLAFLYNQNTCINGSWRKLIWKTIILYNFSN